MGAGAYAADTDFDRGTLVNVNHAAPRNNQLQLDHQTQWPLSPALCVQFGLAGTPDWRILFAGLAQACWGE